MAKLSPLNLEEGLSHSRMGRPPFTLPTHHTGLRTPAKDGEAPQVLLLGEKGHEDEAVQVQPLHQNPVVVGGQEVKEEGHSHTAASLGDQLELAER